MSLDQVANAAFQAVGLCEPPDKVTDLEDAICALQTMTEVAKWAATYRDDLADRIARSAPDDRERDDRGKPQGTQRFTAGGSVWEVHRKAPRRTNWDSDGLLRLVVDSRVRNEQTGEIESTLDVIKKVYPLAGYNARVTALKKLNINPDEFSSVEWQDRFTLREYKP